MITSTANPQIKQVLQLMKKGKLRREQGVFLVEGIKMYEEAPRERIRKVYVSFSLYQKKMIDLSGIQVQVVDDRVFSRLSDTKTPQGILCIVSQLEYTWKEMIKGKAPLLLLLDNLQDPGNMGTILRSAEAAGVEGILLTDDCVDIYHPKVIRSTMGAIYRVPFCVLKRGAELTEVVRLFKEQGIRFYAAHLQGTQDYDREHYLGGTAFLIGNEGNGLSQEVTDMADVQVKIPMKGQAESLNAGVAASLLLFEASRQRRNV